MEPRRTKKSRRKLETKDLMSFKDWMEPHIILEKALSDPSFQKMIVEGLTRHFASKATADRWLADALRFARMIIERSQRNFLIDEDVGKAVALLLDSSQITTTEISACIPFSERTANRIVATFQRWSEVESWLPDFQNFKDLVNSDLMLMWIEHEAVKFVADIFGDEPYTMPSVGVYRQLRERRDFGHYGFNTMRRIEVELDKIASKYLHEHSKSLRH